MNILSFTIDRLFKSAQGVETQAGNRRQRRAGRAALRRFNKQKTRTNRVYMGSSPAKRLLRETIA